MHVDPPSLFFRDVRRPIRGDSSATGVQLQGPEGAQRPRALSAATSELCSGSPTPCQVLSPENLSLFPFVVDVIRTNDLVDVPVRCPKVLPCLARRPLRRWVNELRASP
jgi:hypothetical protein